MTRPREAGQITIMIIGYLLVAGLAVGVIVNASNAFLQRRSLASWADGAVLAAAQSVDHRQLYDARGSATLPLSEAAAREAVSGYITRHGVSDRFVEFQVVAVAVDGRTGRVTVRFNASVPLVMMGDLAATPITADASAVATLTP